MQNMDTTRVEDLLGIIGCLPFEYILVSFVFQLVGTYIKDLDDNALLDIVMKRLQVAHSNMQVRLAHPLSAGRCHATLQADCTQAQWCGSRLAYRSLCPFARASLFD
jgi:hypothetical protein